MVYFSARLGRVEEQMFRLGCNLAILARSAANPKLHNTLITRLSDPVAGHPERFGVLAG